MDVHKVKCGGIDQDIPSIDVKWEATFWHKGALYHVIKHGVLPNGPLIGDFLNKTSIHGGFSIAKIQSGKSVFNGKTHYKLPFSIAMLAITRGYTQVSWVSQVWISLLQLVLGMVGWPRDVGEFPGHPQFFLDPWMGSKPWFSIDFNQTTIHWFWIINNVNVFSIFSEPFCDPCYHDASRDREFRSAEAQALIGTLQYTKAG